MELSYRKLIGFSIILSIFCFTGCVTTKRIFPVGDLCGVIVDENNNPVSGYLVICSNKGSFKESTITNNSGIFVFPGLETGVYYIQGEKNNYGKIKKREYNFNDSSSMFCCQVSTIDNILDSVDLLINAKEFGKGVELLNNVFVENDKHSNIIILAYKAYLFNRMGDRNKYQEYVSCLRETKNNKILNFIELMEKNNYEK